MAKPGVFTVLVNDAKIDQLFTASALLRTKITEITNARKRCGLTNTKPTIADIEKTHFLYVHGHYKPHIVMGSEYIKVKPLGNDHLSTTSSLKLDFEIPTYSHFFTDIVFHVRLDEVKAGKGELMCYTSYPGIRLFEEVAFSSGFGAIDSYNYHDVLFKDKFEVNDNMRVAWDKIHGQQTLQTAEAWNRNEFTNVAYYKSGLQTPKKVHEATDLWVPAHFWFCKDPKQALLNDMSVTESTKKVSVTLSNISKVLATVDEATGDFTPYSESNMQIMVEMYVGCMFVSPDVYDIMLSRISYSLIRVHKSITKMVNGSKGKIFLSQLRFPCEYLYVGVKDTQRGEVAFRNWHLYGTPGTYDVGKELTFPVIEYNKGQVAHEIVVKNFENFDSLRPMIKSVGLTSDGIDLFKMTPASFYNSYLPIRNINHHSHIAPKDESVWLIPFCLFPGEYNPSGYFNLSRIKDTALYYERINTRSKDDMIVMISSSVLNFLIRDGAQIKLRYNI
uniref:Major capsid protein homolog protein n=1 Tax=Abalone asfa-like virus TaxID=2839893 RepID=A0A5K7XZC0_9VIRU|nr:major capsid protein homolog protein [Abalone asfa-like virus]BCY04617.1 putative major capsid protein [Abalone asfa-like virus]